MEPRQDRLWRRAEQHRQQGNSPAARTLYEALIAHDPRHVPARLRLIAIAQRSGRIRQAVEHAQSALKVEAQDPVAIARLANLLVQLGETRAALDCATRPEIRQCKSAPVLAEMALALSKTGQEPTALALLERAIMLGMESPESTFLYATLLTHCGRLDEAQRAFERCLAQAPSFAKAHLSIARLRTQTPAHNHVVRLQQRLAGTPSGTTGESDLAFALFKELDDLGRHDEAWSALERGRIAKRNSIQFDAGQDAAVFERLIDRCTPDFLAGQSQSHPGPIPIFIVGMPRSGTTLLERMLGNHPEATNAGELLDFPLQLRWSCDRNSAHFLDEALIERAMDIDYRQLAARYLAHSQWRSGGRPYYTDKLPVNFLQVGFIHRALPQARILHMVRDPMATCFSNLKELFARAYPHSYDQVELAGHYLNYRRLMAHWHDALPGRILDVAYADLVRAPEDTFARVMRFCGLAHVSGCSRIERNRVPVSTASSVQVREPVHDRFLANWKPYARQLAPLRQRLAALEAGP